MYGAQSKNDFERRKNERGKEQKSQYSKHFARFFSIDPFVYCSIFFWKTWMDRKLIYSPMTRLTLMGYSPGCLFIIYLKC